MTTYFKSALIQAVHQMKRFFVVQRNKFAMSSIRKTNRFILLLISILQILFVPNFAKAQITNELAFESLVMKSYGNLGASVDTLKGFLTENLKTSIPLQTNGELELNIEVPSISFRRLSRKMYERNVDVIIDVTDSTVKSGSYNYHDTLHGGAIKQVRKSQYPELRGHSPRIAAKFLGPAVLIGTAIAVIISLFYLRS